MSAPIPNSTPTFEALMTEVMATAHRFGHREHVHLTWLAVRHCGTNDAIGLVSEGIQRTARYAGAPQKYHVTMSRAWVELVGHHISETATSETESEHADGDDFAAFAEHHTALFDKRLLTRFYRSATLAADDAKSGWVEPDLAPFPWAAEPDSASEAEPEPGTRA